MKEYVGMQFVCYHPYNSCLCTLSYHPYLLIQFFQLCYTCLFYDLSIS